jgi:hypothetical protein
MPHEGLEAWARLKRKLERRHRRHEFWQSDFVAALIIALACLFGLLMLAPPN